MATNLKGQSGIKGMLLLHGEKIAIAIVGVIALGFIYRSFSLPRLEDKFQANKLDEAINKASAEVKDFTWDTAVKDHPEKVKKAQPITAKGDLTVKFDDYVSNDAKGKPVQTFDTPIVAPLILRTDPLMLNVVDVRATGGSGLFAFIDDKIRAAQALRRATEEAEAAKKAADKQKKEAQKQKEGGAPGGARRGRGPEVIGEEPVDPAHPKRRMVEGSTRMASTMLQGGERIERAYWACVVAKVPIREQLKLYQDAFEKARGGDATRDFPSYVGYYVERAEVLPGKELDWKPVALYDAQRNGQQSIAENKPLTTGPAHVVAKPAFDKLMSAAQQFWAGGVPQDVIDERFAEFPLTLPLPPLVGREWGAEATHPDIPLAINTLPLEDESQQAAAKAAEQQAAQTDPNAEFGTANPSQGPGPGGTNTGPGQMGAFPGGQGPGQGPRRFSQEFGPGMTGPGMTGPGMPGGGRRMTSQGPGGPEGGGAYRGGSGQTASQHTFLPKGVDFYLLRFFDFSVEPGKKYKYHVKLVVSDPNYNLPQGVLSPAVLDRQAKEAPAYAKAHNGQKPFFRLIGKWSDPSPTVGIPMAGNVRLADFKIPPPEKFNDEPSVKMLVEAFDVDDTGNPIQAAAEKDFHRGYVANMVQDAEYQPDPSMIDTQPGFKFLTGMTLLDVDGGMKISKESKDLTVPTRIMVMGPAGELYIRNELDDKPFVESHRLVFEKPSDKRGGPMGPEGPGQVGPSRPRSGAPRR